MLHISDKREALLLAREFLGRNEDVMLRHAALELRRCIEGVVYEKLSVYRDRLTAEVTRRWQPPQAFKALIAIEPEAARTTRLGMAWQEEEGVPANGPFYLLGVDRRPDVGWLNKTYNKLGNLLHSELPFGSPSLGSKPVEARVFLEETAATLEPFVNDSITSGLGVVETFTCSVCGSKVVASHAGVQKNGFVVCLNPECEARYAAEQGEDGFLFNLVESLAKCPQCNETISMPDCKVRVGYEVTCSACGAKAQVEQYWVLRPSDSQEKDVASPGS